MALFYRKRSVQAKLGGLQDAQQDHLTWPQPLSQVFIVRRKRERGICRLYA